MKRDTVPEFEFDNVDVKPTDTIRKALTILANAPNPFGLNLLCHKGPEDILPKFASDATSVSTASTSFSRDEESDIEIDQHENDVLISDFPPDALFIVQGREFPCHKSLISEEARPLFDILLRDGVLERKAKKQRMSSSSRYQSEGEDFPQTWSTPSGIIVAQLSNDFDSDFFQVLMEFLYTQEIRMKLPEGYHEDDQEVDPWLDKEDIFDDDEEEDFDQLLNLTPSMDDETDTTAPLKFLQGCFSLADRFGCTAFKKAIEIKLYDEYLFSFTAKELFIWADENNCSYLKQKAMERLPEPSFEKQRMLT